MTDEKVEQNKINKRINLEGLFNDLLGPVVVGSLVATFLCYYLRDYIESTILITWSGLTVLGGILRLTVKESYRRFPEKCDTERWHLFYTVATLFVATMWAIIPIIVMNKVPVEKEIFIVAIILGLASGGAISHIASKFTAFYYSSSIVLGHMIKTIIENKPDAMLLVAAEGLFIYLIFKMVKKFNLIYEDSQRMAVELSEKIDLEHELQREKVKALQNSKLASLGEMAAGIAHEINNPLAVSMGKLHVVLKSVEKGSQPIDFYKKQLNEVLESNKRVADIVQSMRNLSRMQDEVEFLDFKIHELLELTLPLIKIKIQNSKVEIIEDYEDLEIEADKGELGQVLLNLLHNSIDAIKDSSGEKWIKIESMGNKELVELRITDSGLLSDITDQEKIFEPFYTSKVIGEGTGLGLSLSKGMMERNNGTLSLDLNSRNTCFIMKIKAAQR